MNVQEAYKLLRLPPDSGLDEVKKSFRKLAFSLHPDLNPDNPRAGRHFQRINEAYVLLKRHLEDNANKAAPGSDKKARKAQTPPPGPTARPRPETSNTFDDAQTEKNTREQRASQAYRRASKQAAGAQSKEEVLNDILQDPFARQVFEDIYSEIRRGGDAGKKRAPLELIKTKSPFPWSGKFKVPLTPEAWGRVKSWLRSQLDEERVMYVAAELLRPGAKIRLQLRLGLSSKTKSVEVVLPKDYSPGRAVRVKGLGRRLGPWQGDLYLRLLAA